MLSRQLLCRKITSIRPSRLSLHTLPRNLLIQRHLCAVRPYSQNAGKSASTAEGSKPTSETNPLENKPQAGTAIAETKAKRGRPKKSLGNDTPKPKAAPPPPLTPFAQDLARLRAERYALRGSVKKDISEDEEEKRQRKLDMRLLYAEQEETEKMERPEGMSAENFNAMTVAERIKLRWDLREIRNTHRQQRDPAARAAWEGRLAKYEDQNQAFREQRAAKRAAEKIELEEQRRKKAEKKIKKMECPEGMDPKDWDLIGIEERKLLLKSQGGATRKKPIHLTPEEIEFNIAKAKTQRVRWLKKHKIGKMACPLGVVPEDFDKMTVDEKYDLFEKLDLLPQARVQRKEGTHRNDKMELVSARQKVKSIATKTVQYKQEVVKALREAGIDGNDLDFSKGTVFASADTSRMNITSGELCDDVLMRLGPSLEKHKGCDIIDINPGVGVWSSKLHDFLKPRSHILMEPDGIYANQLAKFVEQDPTYKHVPLSGIIWQNLLKLEEDKLLPHQTWRSLADPELDKPNDTLLVTLNLGYYPRRSYLGFASLTHLVMNQLFTASRAHSVFQAYGQIRMLVWVHDYEKRIIVPRTLSLRKKSAIEAETCSEYIREVCGADGSTEVAQRGRSVNLISARRVRKLMEEAGISTPAHRMSRLEAEMREAMDAGTEQDATISTSWHDDLEMLRKGLAEKKFPMYEDPKTGRPTFIDNPEDLDKKGRTLPRVPAGMVPSPAWHKWTQLRNRMVSDGNQEKQILEMTSEYEILEDKYVAISKMDMSEEDKERQQEIVAKQIKAWSEKVNRQIEQRRRRVKQNVVEQKAIMLDEPVLEWDRRVYEPMVTKPHEFWPRQEMALLDIQPKTLWPSLTKNALGDYDYYDLLLSCLCHYPNRSIVERLQAFAPGADEWIIPRCPSLRDVQKGGCIDLEMLTVRNMTTGMLREVFEGFMKWPFRPGKGRMLQMLGSTSVHEEDMEESGAGGKGAGW